MKTIRRFATLVAAVLIAAPIAHATPQLYSSGVFTATATNSTKSFGFIGATTVVVSNAGDNEIFISFNGAASAATTSIYIAANSGRRWTFAQSEGIASVGVICSSAETASVTVEAYGGSTPVDTYVVPPNAAQFDDLSLVDDAVIGDALSVVGNATVGGTLGVTGATTTAAVSSTTIAASGNITAAAQIVITPTAQSVTDGGGGATAFNIAATVGVVHVTCNDADGCAATLLETSAVSGSQLLIINVGTNAVTIADSAGVQETTGALSLGANDNVAFCYRASTWVQCSPVVDVT